LTREAVLHYKLRVTTDKDEWKEGSLVFDVCVVVVVGGVCSRVAQLLHVRTVLNYNRSRIIHTPLLIDI